MDAWEHIGLVSIRPRKIEEETIDMATTSCDEGSSLDVVKQRGVSSAILCRTGA